MRRFYETYRDDFKDPKDPEYEGRLRLWLTVVRTAANRFFATSLDVGEAMPIAPSQIFCPPSYLLTDRAVINAFSDIRRIRNYHNIGEIEIIEFAAYIGYWLAKAKPFSLRLDKYDAPPIKKDGGLHKAIFNLCFSLNEVFVAEFMLSIALSKNDVSKEVLAANTLCLREREGCKFESIASKTILDSLHYYLSYQLRGAQELELFLKGLLACPIDCVSSNHPSLHSSPSS